MKRLIKAFKFSIAGIRSCYKNEAAFRQEVWLAAVLIPLAFYIGQSLMEYVVLVGVVFFVLVTELLNSAVENVVDRTGKDYHKLSGRAKDQGSAAVMFSLIFAFIVWLGFVLKFFSIIF